ncbi:MAG: Flp family type IVb pilin [Stellaceae bacterium]
MPKLCLRRLAADERGTTAIEYALIASIISIVIAGTLNSISGYLIGTFNTVAGAL